MLNIAKSIYGYYKNEDKQSKMFFTTGVLFSISTTFMTTKFIFPPSLFSSRAAVLSQFPE